MANLSDHRDSHLYPSHSFSISQERLIKPPVSYSVYTVFWGDVQNSLSGLVSQSVQSLHHVLLFTTPWTAACQASLSITSSWSLLTLMSIESVMLSNHLILCCLLLLPLQSFPASGSFPMNQFFASGGQSIGVSASASVFPMTIQN